MKRVALLLVALAAASCSASTERDEVADPVFDTAAVDEALTIERGERVTGQLLEEGIDVRFSSQMKGKDIEVRVELNGMILTATYGKGGQASYSGVSASDGTPTLMTESDRAALRRLLAGLGTVLVPSVDGVTTKDEYDALRRLSPAEQKLLGVIDRLWSQWPSTVPLDRNVDVEMARSWRSNRRHAASGQTVLGCHDCGSCDWDNLDESNCCDNWALGSQEGANFGNCGMTDWDTQFTWDCTNHDQCVRTEKHGGHVVWSLYCDDQFTSCVDDEASAPSCDYDWRQNKSGSSWTYRADCPTSWNGTSDGCDCFCQFMDADCDSKSGITCDYSWDGSSYANNCPLSWNSTGDGCDCGCQFMDYDCY